jgi:hypothetical protein
LPFDQPPAVGGRPAATLAALISSGVEPTGTKRGSRCPLICEPVPDVAFVNFDRLAGDVGDEARQGPGTCARARTSIRNLSGGRPRGCRLGSAAGFDVGYEEMLRTVVECLGA